MYRLKISITFLFILTTKLTTTQNDTEVYCPEEYNLIPNTKICILCSLEAPAHDNQCLTMGSTSIRYYLELIMNRSRIIIEFLRRNGVTKFWLPIAKNMHHFLVWKLPIPLWNRRIIEINGEIAPKNYTDGDCALYETKINKMAMTNCRYKYPHVCFYDTNESLLTHTEICANKLMSRVSKFHGICYRIEEFDFKSNISLPLVHPNVSIIVAKNFIKMNNMDTMKILIAGNYKSATNERVSVISNGVIGWANISDVHYRLVEYKVDSVKLNQNSLIDISYQADIDTVSIAIKRFENIWNPQINDVPLTCHYDINILHEQISYEFKHINTSGTTQFLSLTLPYYKGVGNFWCEAQMLVTFETITSNKLVLQRNIDPPTTVLCVYIEKNYCELCNNIYRELKQIREFTKELHLLINELDDYDVHDVQLKKIIDIGANRTKYLYHIVLDSTEPENVDSYFKNELIELDLNGYQIGEVRFNDECSSSNQYFSSAKLNHKSVIKTLCILDTGLPPTQDCVGNLIDGAIWRQIYDINELLLKTCNKNMVNERTTELFNLNELLRKLNLDGVAMKNETHEIVEKTIAIINKTVTMEHNDTDLRYATETLHNLLETVSIEMFNEEVNEKDASINNQTTFLEPIADIIDTILSQETSSSVINENNQILETIDLLADKIAKSNPVTNTTSNTTHYDNDDGCKLIHKQNYIIMIVNPLINNITGIALYKIDDRVTEKSFYDFNVRKIRSNETLPSIYNDSLEVMVHIPAESFEKIKIIRNGELVPPNRIIYKIHYKNSLFNENTSDLETNGTTKTIESESKVIGITIPDFYERELPSGIFTLFKTSATLQHNTDLVDKLGCSDRLIERATSKWNREIWNYGKVGASVVVCPVKRLANVGLVKLLGNKIVTDHTYTDSYVIISQVLHYTTLVGCVLSLIGLILIFVTALIFESWKNRETIPLLLNVSIVTFLQLGMFVVAELGTFSHPTHCLIIGGFLHYVTLCGFFISLFVTNCQYRRYIIVFGSAKTKNFKIKIFFVGWIVPLLIVVGCLIFKRDSYIPNHDLQNLGGICYPTELILYLFVHAPIVLIFCINVGVYIWIIYRVTHENENLRKTPKKSKVLIQIRLFFYIFFMMSLTWAFGLLAHYLESIIFGFIFNVTAPMQGFCLFIFSIVIDDKTRRFWTKLVFRTVT